MNIQIGHDLHAHREQEEAHQRNPIWRNAQVRRGLVDDLERRREVRPTHVPERTGRALSPGYGEVVGHDVASARFSRSSLSMGWWVLDGNRIQRAPITGCRFDASGAWQCSIRTATSTSRPARVKTRHPVCRKAQGDPWI